MQAGVLAALQDLGVADVDHLAGGPADHLQHVLAAAGEGQGLAEDPAGAQLLQDCRDAVLIDADERGGSPSIPRGSAWFSPPFLVMLPILLSLGQIVKK